MVKRWEAAEFNMVLDETGGEYVLYSDYQALQKALEEALDGWQADLAIYCVDNKVFEHRNKKPSQLRSLYLGEK